MRITSGAVRPMAVDDVAAVVRVADAAGERFRTVPDDRIARCADDPSLPVDALVAYVDAGRAWVVADGDDVVGFVLVDVLDGRAHVEEVSVDPDHEGRGHGSALLDAASRWAADNGADAVTLTTFTDVPWNRPFYERRGFRVLDADELTPELAARRAEEDDHGLPAELRVAMLRPVGPGPSVSSDP